jgi:hypothetical protein
MNGVGSSSTLGILDSSTNWDDHIIQNEILCKFYESQVLTLPRLGDLWIHVDPFFIGGTIRFSNPNILKNYRWGIKSFD